MLLRPAPRGCPRARGRAAATTSTSYLAIAARFRSADHSAAMDEIRSWTLPEIEAAAAGLRRQGSRLRAVPEAPGDIDFRTVEAAVLLHAEAGLLSLQSISLAEAACAPPRVGRTARLAHTPRRTSSGSADGRSRRESTVGTSTWRWRRPPSGSGSRARPAPSPKRRGALPLWTPRSSGAGLRGGDPRPGARPRAPGFGGRAPARPGGTRPERRPGHRPGAAGSTASARPAPGRPGPTRPGESLLDQVEAEPADNRQRYLARLFLGRLAAARGHVDDAAGFYRRALEVWPDSQAARLALAEAPERSSGPSVAWPLVAGSLAASGRLD